MASIDVEKLKADSIIIARFGADYDIKEGMSETRKVIGKAFRGQLRPVYYIINISAIKFTFTQLVMTLAELTDPKSGPYRNPLVKEVIFVTDNELGKMAADALQQEQYGSLQSKLFTSEEEAIEYVRSLVGK